MSCRVSKEVFGRIVEEAIAALPALFASALETMRVEVRDRASRGMLKKARVPDGQVLLGLYVGRPRTHRSVEDTSSFPDVIYLFKDELENICHSREQLADQIRMTFLHELGHHFGLDEDKLDELGYG